MKKIFKDSSLLDVCAQTALMLHSKATSGTKQLREAA